jgi:hypothetical protein
MLVGIGSERQLTMSMTILLFQAAIALTIFASGHRYRTLAAAGWALFTLAMVYVYWLALIQFGTIAVAWHYAGVPFGSTHCKTLLARARGLHQDESGYLELECWNCVSCRCRSAKIKTAGCWPSLSVAPTSANLKAQRAELAVELDSEARKLEARRPGHHLIQRMQAEAKRLRVQQDPTRERQESDKYLWINERAESLHTKFVQRLTLVDLLPLVTILSVPVFLVALFIGSAGHYDKQDAKMLIAIASVTLTSYLLQVLVGLYWYSRRRFLMPHLFIPGGGLQTLWQGS